MVVLTVPTAYLQNEGKNLEQIFFIILGGSGLKGRGMTPDGLLRQVARLDHHTDNWGMSTNFTQWIGLHPLRWTIPLSWHDCKTLTSIMGAAFQYLLSLTFFFKTFFFIYFQE